MEKEVDFFFKVIKRFKTKEMKERKEMKRGVFKG